MLDRPAAEGFSRASADVVDLPRAFDPGQGMSDRLTEHCLHREVASGGGSSRREVWFQQKSGLPNQRVKYPAHDPKRT